MPFEVLTEKSILRRRHWIEEIAKISGKFDDDSAKVERELADELQQEGVSALLDHLHMCGAVPEHYGHDSSEEKLYSKYTDALLAATYRHMGLTSIVLMERADSADVEAVSAQYSLVADAKVFRLSRTAKNQKDFKIEALHGWKRGKPYAMVVCPIYQLPSRKSQIYQQAITRNVCIFSYSHLAVLVRFADLAGELEAQSLLLRILNCAEEVNPTKDSVAYWTCINRTMLSANDAVKTLWQEEKLATVESIDAAKEEALTMLALEREQIMRMSRDEAILRLVEDRNIDGREKVIRAIGDNGILSMA
ncbi:MAG: HindIII family type II restriction endonuclease [Acidobacteriaceae bacterium]|nr:HindIII family type II restriction endonuclease [Acidobacteriaceae bacterium]